MKKWIPDYENRGTINLLSGNPSSVTITEDGFVCYRIKQQGSHTDAAFRVNGKLVTASVSEGNAIADTSSMLPVANGDVLTYTYNTGTSDNYIYFIPGRWV